MVQAVLQIPIIVNRGEKKYQNSFRGSAFPPFQWVLLSGLPQSVTPEGFLLSPVGAEN